MIALLLACAAWRLPPGPSPAELREQVRARVEMPVSGARVAWVQVAVRAGSAYDPIGKEGLASLTANLLREGGAGGLSPEEMEERLFGVGADVNVVVDKELVTFRARVVAEDAPQVVPWLADMLTSPQFDEAAFQRLRQEAAVWLRSGIFASEEALGDALFDIWLHEGHPYGHAVEGRTGALEPMTLDDVRAFWSAAYTREAVSVGVAAADPGPLANDLVQRLEGTLSAGERLEATPRPRPTVQGRHLLAVQAQSSVTGFHLGHPIEVDRAHADYPALLLGSIALGEHRESHGRLYRAMRTARGLNYGDYAYVEHYRQGGGGRAQEWGTGRVQPQFSIWLRPVATENAAFALKMAIRILEDFVSGGLSAEDLERYKEYASARLKVAGQDPGRRLGFALEAAAMGHPDLLQSLPAQWAALDLATVNAAIKRHIDPANLKILAVTGDAAGLVRALSESSPTPVVYNGVTPDAAQAAEDERVAAQSIGLTTSRVIPSEDLFR